LTSTLAVAVQAGIRYLVLLSMHELVLAVIIALVSPEEIEISLFAAVPTQLSYQAIDLFMSQVIA